MSSSDNDINSPGYSEGLLQQSCRRLPSRRSRRPRNNLKDSSSNDGRKSKQQTFSTSLVIKWLSENYVMEPGSCLPRCALYSHYQDFCRKRSVMPHTAATFGKIVRVKFPDLKTRRLGVRGQSKYHYFGLAVRESSVYFKNRSAKKGITRFTDRLSKNEFSAYSPSSKFTLPPFPLVDSLALSQSFAREKLKTFMLMYRAHCERLHDAVAKGKYDEIQDFVIHFWKGMPSHVLPVLDYQVTLDLLMLCDTILYKTLCDVLVPDTLQSVDSNYSSDVLQFAKNLESWFKISLPSSVNKVKLEALHYFQRSIKQQLNLMELTKNARCIMQLDECIHISLSDLQAVDKSSLFNCIEKVKLQSYKLNSHTVLLEFFSNLEQTLMSQSKVEDHFLWIDNMFEVHVSKFGSDSDKINASHDFLLLWNFFITHVEIELITNKAKCQGVLNSLFKLLTQYIIYVIELIQSHVNKEQYWSAFKSHTGLAVCDSPQEDINVTSTDSSVKEHCNLETMVLADVNLGKMETSLSENFLHLEGLNSYDDSSDGTSSSSVSNFMDDSPFSSYSPSFFDDCFSFADYPISCEVFSPEFGLSFGEENYYLSTCIKEDIIDNSYSSCCRNMSELLKIIENTEKLLSN